MNKIQRPSPSSCRAYVCYKFLDSGYMFSLSSQIIKVFSGSYCRYIPWLWSFGTTLSERFMRSWAKQRFVAASSRRTDEKVASRKGSGKHCLKASRARALSLNLMHGLGSDICLPWAWSSHTVESTALRASVAELSAAPPAG